MKLKKEWNDVEKTSNELMRLFNSWRISNLRITKGRGNTLEETFGFPYTSSSDYAAIVMLKPDYLTLVNPESNE